MKAVVVYDSVFGNTGQIAQAVAQAIAQPAGNALGSQEDVQTFQVGDVTPGQLTGVTMLVVGSPTRQFKATPATTRLLKGIPKNGLAGVKVAAFDTRFTVDEIEKVRILAFFVKIFGYAAKPIADSLEKKGGELVAPPEGFFVADVEGPLLDGELERAADWAERITARLA